MTAQYIRVLEGTTLSEGDMMDLAEAIDLCKYGKLEIVVRVSQAGEGTAPTLIVEHSASNEEGSYIPFSTVVEVDLTTTGYSWFHQDSFTRWVSWRLSGSLSSSAIVTLEIIAKP